MQFHEKRTCFATIVTGFHFPLQGLPVYKDSIIFEWANSIFYHDGIFDSPCISCTIGDILKILLT